MESTSSSSNSNILDSDEDIKTLDEMLTKLKLKLSRFSQWPNEDRYQFYQENVGIQIVNYFLGKIITNNDDENDMDIIDFQFCEVLKVITNDLIKFHGKNDINNNFNCIRATLNIIPIIITSSISSFNTIDNVILKLRINEVLEIMTKILDYNINDIGTKYIVYDTLLFIYHSFKNIPSILVDIKIGSELIKRIDSILVKIYLEKNDFYNNDIIELVLGSLSTLSTMQPQLLYDYKIVENGVPVYGILVHVIRYIGCACMRHNNNIYLDICRNILKLYNINIKQINTKNDTNNEIHTLKCEISIINKEFCAFLKSSKEDQEIITCYWNNWMKALSVFVEILPSHEKSMTIINLFNTVEAGEGNGKKERVLVTQLSGIFEKYSKKEYSLYLATFLLSAVKIITPVIKSHGDSSPEQNVNDWLSDRIYLNLLIQIFRCLNRLVIKGIIENDDCSDQLIERVVDVVTVMADCCWLTASYVISTGPASIFHVKYKSSKINNSDIMNDPRYPDKFIDLMKYVLELRDGPSDNEFKRRRLMLLQKGIVRIVCAIFKNGQTLVTSLRSDVDKEDILNRGLFAQQSSDLDKDVKIPDQIVIIEFVKLIELSFIMLMSNSIAHSMIDSDDIFGLIRSWQIGVNSLGRIISYLPDEEICNTYDDGLQHPVLNKITLNNRAEENVVEIYNIVRSIWISFWRHSCNLKYELWRGQFLEGFWWYLHRMSGFSIPIRDNHDSDAMCALLSLHNDIDNCDTALLNDATATNCPKMMVGLALILTMAHGRLCRVEENRLFIMKKPHFEELEKPSTVGSKSLNLLKWAAFRSVNGMLQSSSLLSILRFIETYITDSGLTDDNLIDKICSKVDIAKKFVIFERSEVFDDRFNISVLSAIISSTLKHLGQLNGHSELQGSQSQQCSQIFQQSSTTPLSNDAEIEMIEGFRLVLGIPLILMSTGQHNYQCILEPEKPWSDVLMIEQIDNSNYNISASDWKKLFRTWLRDLHRNGYCRRVSFFQNSTLHRYGGVVITCDKSSPVKLLDFKSGIEILTSALDVIKNSEPRWQLSLEICDTIGFGIYQSWVNLMMSWTNLVENCMGDLFHVETAITDPQLVLLPLLSILLTIVEIFGDYYISEKCSMTIFKNDDNFDINNDINSSNSDDDSSSSNDDGNTDDNGVLYSKEDLSLKIVITALFQLPVLIMKATSISLNYVDTETIIETKRHSPTYIVNTLESLIKLAEILSKNKQKNDANQNLSDILGHDFIEKMMKNIKALSERRDIFDMSVINDRMSKLNASIGYNSIVYENDDISSFLGKRKESAPENENAKKKIDEIEMFIESDCYDDNKRVKIKSYLEEVKKLL